MYLFMQCNRRGTNYILHKICMNCYRLRHVLIRKITNSCPVQTDSLNGLRCLFPFSKYTDQSPSSEAHSPSTFNVTQIFICTLLASCFVYVLVLKMDASYSSKILAEFKQNTRCYSLVHESLPWTL